MNNTSTRAFPSMLNTMVTLFFQFEKSMTRKSKMAAGGNLAFYPKLTIYSHIYVFSGGFRVEKHDRDVTFFDKENNFK